MNNTQVKKGYRQPKKPTKKTVQAENAKLKEEYNMLYQGVQFLAQNMTRLTREVVGLQRETQAMANLLRCNLANDSSIQLGDDVMLDFTGSLINEDGSEGELVEGGYMLGSVIEIGSNSYIQGFESGMLGAKQGETRVLDLVFPENYKSEELKGKAVRFTVKVINIWRKGENDNEISELHRGKVAAKNLKVKGPRSADLPQGGPTRAMIAQANGVDVSEVSDEMVLAEHDTIRKQMAEKANAEATEKPAKTKASKKKATKKTTK